MDTSRKEALLYIQEHLQQGHTEVALRQHFRNHGWAYPDIDEIFKQAMPGSNTPQYAPQTAGEGSEISEKSYVAAWLLSFLFGSYGVDRFYLGFIWTGILKLITLGGLGLWFWIDLVRIGFGVQKDKQGRKLEGYEENKTIIKILTVVILGLPVAGILFLALLLFLAD